MNLTDVFWNGVEIVFVISIFAIAAVGNRTSLESRADAIARTDPGTAAALRQAQAVSDYTYGLAQWVPEVIIVCTPSRRGMLSGDADEFVVPSTVPTIPARAVAEPPVVSARADAAHAARPRIVYVIATSARRTAPATRPVRAGSRRTRRYRAARERSRAAWCVPSVRSTSRTPPP